MTSTWACPGGMDCRCTPREAEEALLKEVNMTSNTNETSWPAMEEATRIAYETSADLSMTLMAEPLSGYDNLPDEAKAAWRQIAFKAVNAFLEREEGVDVSGKVVSPELTARIEEASKHPEDRVPRPTRPRLFDRDEQGRTYNEAVEEVPYEDRLVLIYSLRIPILKSDVVDVDSEGKDVADPEGQELWNKLWQLNDSATLRRVAEEVLAGSADMVNNAARNGEIDGPTIEYRGFAKNPQTY